MRRLWAAAAVALLALTGCGIQPSEVTDAGEPPTGVAPGVTLYFVDRRGELRPQPRETGRLGTIPDALTLLLLGPGGFAPGDSALRTEIPPVEHTRVEVTVDDGTIELRVPLAEHELSPLGIDQLVCTALDVHVRSGGSPATTVRILFTVPAPGSDRPRTCPLIG
ncbi:hypothetical protein [Allonocardiopsis opalescens]|uniref:Sporulation and spore germination protein n=1 Tax=Allonocardiopsis opalescens TaxID=1144618 RepID=A0A2T0Q2H0_9ACTN|nr:hypothetical protein [Allonocardiopsis opalescens]PRX97991.1 hypothetical protein CLV72_105344 [Allonocardiopsis opalescens]